MVWKRLVKIGTCIMSQEHQQKIEQSLPATFGACIGSYGVPLDIYLNFVRNNLGVHYRG